MQLKLIKNSYCSRCGRVFPVHGDNHLCGDCLTPKWMFDKARSFVAYEKIIASLIHKLKYSGEMTGLDTFKWLSEQSDMLDDLATPDLILPVPLHLKRLRKRGFNQALILAKTIFPEKRNKIRPNLLSRRIDTPSQKGLSGEKRRKNLLGAFTVTNPSEVAEKNILLFDDVFTTGSTANECAKALKSSGCKKVEILTICRADKIFF